MFCRRQFTNFEVDSHQIRQIRRGRIVMREGRLVRVEEHWLRSPVSVAQIWWESQRGRLQDDVCLLDYHVPRGMSNFLTLDYVRAGAAAKYKTFVGACHLLHEIARLRGSSAIVAHVTNVEISDRFLERMGWERHLPQWRGRHYIRRFYDGYPKSVADRYAI